MNQLLLSELAIGAASFKHAVRMTWQTVCTSSLEMSQRTFTYIKYRHKRNRTCVLRLCKTCKCQRIDQCRRCGKGVAGNTEEVIGVIGLRHLCREWGSATATFLRRQYAPWHPRRSSVDTWGKDDPKKQRAMSTVLTLSLFSNIYSFIFTTLSGSTRAVFHRSNSVP